jgi:hypothetical protein
MRKVPPTEPTAPKTSSAKGKSLPAWVFHLLAILGFVAVTCLYFLPQLEGKKVMQGDILQWEGMAQEALEYQKETGELTLWTNSMFGGMPTYQINNFQPNNLLQYVQNAGELFFEAPIGLFLAASLSMYVLLIVMGVGPGLAWLGAFSFAFSAYHVIIYEAGHYLKLQAIGTFPWILAGLYLIFQRKLLAGAALFSLGLGLSFYANHVQMTYYLAIVLGLYFLGESIRMLRDKAVKQWAIGALLLAGGAVLALSSGASKLYTSYEYSHDTMRGEPILQPGQDPGSSSETEGLAWEYAMQWSQGPLELFTVLVPGIVGGSSSERISDKSAIRTELRQSGVNLPADFKAPLYWGELPFTSGPVYFGVIVLFLFVFGLFAERGAYKWWLLAGVLFTFLFSLGKHAEGFNRLVFDYLPLMNKFRSPNSITAVTPLLMLFLGFAALRNVFNGVYEAERIKKSLLYAAGSLGGLALLFGLAGSALFDFAGPGDERLSQMGFPMNAVYEDRKSLLQSDAFRSVALIALAAGLVYFYVQGKVASWMAIGGLLVLGVMDLWTIDRRYLSSEDFKTAREYQAYYTPRPADELILKDVDPHYRVMDVTANTFNSSFASYFHKSIGGYHAAKLQRYQDIIDRHISKNNMKVLNMLNTKYFIVPGEAEGEEATVQVNMEALGNAWFVKTLQQVSTPDEEIDYLGREEFDPVQVAVVHQEFADYTGATTDFSGEGSIKLTSYKPNALEYASESGEDQFVVFSEIWYGPNKGWQAYVDGQPAEHIRVNYVLRGLKLPAGKHKVEFRFEPQSHATGEKVSLAGSLLVMLLIIGGLIIAPIINKRRRMQAD